MYRKHLQNGDVADQNKAEQAEDLAQGIVGHHPGDQRHHAIGGERNHHPHHLHHPQLQGVDGHGGASTSLWMLRLQLQQGSPGQHCEDHHADHRETAATRHIGGKVGGHQREQQGRQSLGTVDGAHALLQGGRVATVAQQPFRGETAQVGDGHPHHTGDHHQGQHRADQHGANLAEGLGLLQLVDCGEDGGEHQRHHHHLEQADIAAADDIDPLQGLLDAGIIGAPAQLQCQPEQGAKQQTRKYLARERQTGGQPGESKTEQTENKRCNQDKHHEYL